MGDKGKRLRIDASGREEKSKILPSPFKFHISPETLPPYFSLRYLQKEYCISKCSKDQKAAFADTILKLTQLSWSEINSCPRHGSGYERIKRNAIHPSIPKNITAEVNIISFRFFGKAPMVGYRDRATFYVVWLDPNFKVYDHG